jgi:Tfp pilus assembly protein PilN
MIDLFKLILGILNAARCDADQLRIKGSPWPRPRDAVDAYMTALVAPRFFTNVPRNSPAATTVRAHVDSPARQAVLASAHPSEILRGSDAATVLEPAFER